MCVSVSVSVCVCVCVCVCVWCFYVGVVPNALKFSNTEERYATISEAISGGIVNVLEEGYKLLLIHLNG